MKRLFKELKMLNFNENPMILKLNPIDGNLLVWEAKIKGPLNSSYEGGLFELSLILSVEYPLKPPKIAFKTKIFHPNIHFETGEICLDLLSTAWSPVWCLFTAVGEIIYLLSVTFSYFLEPRTIFSS